MRVLLLAVFLFASLTLPVRAERVMEVQNIHIDGAAGRDAAVAQATQQAAQQVWAQMGRTAPLPELSPAQLQSIASYIDVANEVAQPNFYAGNFNIGIQVGALMQAATGSAPTIAAPANDAYLPTTSQAAPAWVLLIAAREQGGTLTLWNAEDDWTKAWQRAVTTDIATAIATGDPTDQATLNAALFQENDPALTDRLQTIARKYGAPAVALVVLQSARPQPSINEEISLEVFYTEKDMTDTVTAQSSLFITAPTPYGAYTAAVTEGQKLLHGLATGDAGTPTAPTTNHEAQPESLSSHFGNTYSSATPATPSTEKMWVRIPLATPADLGNYRRKIEAIPGARFEITALNRMYVEGNILYNGDRNILMQHLAAAGLHQQ